MNKNSRPVHTMLGDLEGHTLRQALDAAQQLWGELQLYPGDPSVILAEATRIVEWADSHHIKYLTELNGDVAARLLQDLTGAGILTKVTAAKQLETLHRLRNIITALRGTILVCRVDHERTRRHRPARDSMDAGLPRLAARSTLRRRPLRDDEILLCRLLIQVDLREEAPLLPIHAYLLGEIGLAPMENTRAVTENLDDRVAPRTITAPGVWKFGPRTLKLDAHQQAVLARTVPRLRTGNQPLSYTGTEPGTAKAQASVDPTVVRYLARAGVRGTDIKAKSLSLWRPDHLLRTQRSLKKAVQIHGGRAKNLLHDLCYTVDEAPLHKKKVAIRDHNDKVVAKVPGHHLDILNVRPRYANR